jgi:hypothetical protein
MNHHNDFIVITSTTASQHNIFGAGLGSCPHIVLLDELSQATSGVVIGLNS